MHLFYKKHFKMINMFLGLVFLIFNLSWAIEFRSDGLVEEALIKQKRIHLQAARTINFNLQNKCDIFKSLKLKTSLESKLSEFKLAMSLVTENVISINNLYFEKIIFKTHNLENSNEYVTTYGYLVTHMHSKNCFGLL